MHTESFQGVIEAYADTEDRTRELSIGKERKKKKNTIRNLLPMLFT